MSTPGLQEGIYHAPNRRPGQFLALLVLRVRPTELTAATEALAELWSMYADLKRGRLQDLEGAKEDRQRAQEDATTVLLGFGSGFFERFGDAMPAGLHAAGRFRDPDPEHGGGPVLQGSGLAYEPGLRSNPAASDLCVQVIAETKVAADRAVIETWKLLHDRDAGDEGRAPFELVTFYLGFQRNDRRSWIDFHDGISNLRSADRESVIAIAPDSDVSWAAGGTYLAFLRLVVDLVAWRELGRRDQELAVGRDKLSGCPIIDVADDGWPVTDSRCPVAGAQIWETANDVLFAEPPPVDRPELLRSHVQRANHHQLPPSNPASRRIFRQGFEFLEWAPTSPGFRAGLNFISFQDTPERVTRMLVAENWLGRTNFGGDAGLVDMIRAQAAGTFWVPSAPRRGEPFPGARALAEIGMASAARSG